MKKLFTAFVLFSITLSSTGCGKVYGKYGQCQAYTKKGERCKNNAGKTGYCGKHN